VILPSHSSRRCSRNQSCEVNKQERFGVTKSSKLETLPGRFSLEFSPKGSVNVADLKGETMPDSSTNQRLDSLAKMGKPALCESWLHLFKREPPSGKGLMLRMVAHSLQEEEFGSLNDANCRRLRQLASAFKASPKANELRLASAPLPLNRSRAALCSRD
jgi:hypothetical protein